MYDGDEIKPSVVDSGDHIFRDLVQRDLERTIQDGKLAIEEDQKPILLVQSVLGHAQEGHGVFYEENARFPDATMRNIIKGAGLDVDSVERIRQNLIDDVFEWVELAKKDKVNKLVYKRRPLLGVKFLSDFTIDPEYTLKGVIPGSFMDSHGWREKTLDHYGHRTINGEPLTMGSGETCLVNMDKLMDWTPHYLRHLAYEEITSDETSHLKTIGIIVDTPGPSTEVVYVRRRKGKGTSDDMAFIMMAKMFEDAGWEKARSALLGSFVVDGIDTYDKCVSNPIGGGYDEKLGRDLRKDLPYLVSDDEITALIYYSAKSNGGKLVSSSHRRLIQTVGDKNRMPTLLHHMKFAKDEKHEQFKVGFDQMPSNSFYENVRQRINHYEKHR